MRVLMFGRGALGTQYGWALEKAGHTVEFYVRPGRKAQYGSHVDLELWDARRPKKDQFVKERWSIITRESLGDGGDFDLVVVSVNPEQLVGAVATLAPRVGSATVLFLCHFWQDPELAVSPLPLEQVVWGFPGSGGGFEGNSLYGVLSKTLSLAPWRPQLSAGEHQVRQLFIQAGFTIETPRDARSWRWNRYAMNVAMEIEVLKLGSFGKVAASRQALAGVARNLKELIPILKAKGSKVAVLTRVLASLPPSVVGRLMSRVLSPQGRHYSAMVHNHFKVGYAVGELITEARASGLSAPRLYEVESLIQ